MLRVFFGLCVLGCLAYTFAARPLVTDDARITPRGECQIESWAKQSQGMSELWILPACNPWGQAEITLGGGQKFAQKSQNRDYIAQVKTLIKSFDDTTYGYGLTVGMVAHPDIAVNANQIGNVYCYIPASFAINDLLTLHTNLGITHMTDEQTTALTWGVGGEYTLNPHLILLGESFGDDQHGGYVHGGIRYWLIPSHIQIDATIGHHITVHNDGWISLGVRLLGL